MNTLCPAIASTQPSLRAIDFFCGAGGMTHGLSQAGIDVLGGIDIEEQCRRTYEENNAPALFLQKDIETLSYEELASFFDITRDEPHLVFVGCSPCQYWSKIQTTKEKSKKTAFLLKKFQEFVEYFLPGFVVLENVPGLQSGAESCLPAFTAFLENNDYSVKHDIINAQFYGVPQHRRRFLLIASRSYPAVEFPEKDSEALTVASVLGPSNGFPSVPAGHTDKSFFLHTTATLSEKNLRRIRLTPHNGGTRMAWKDNPELQLAAYKGKDSSFVDVYGRMFWDKPAPTITTRFNSLSNGRFGHPEEDRAISLREGAVLQSFPKDYIFSGSNMHAIARQIGNAVPPALAKRIGQCLLRIVANGQVQDTCQSTGNAG